MANRTSQRKYIGSLLCLLEGLQSQTTTIELRNEITVHGTIENVDERMNITVTKATYTLLNGRSEHFDELFILGTQIRYVQIPDGINVMRVINKKVKQFQGTNRPSYSKQKIPSVRKRRHEEERQMVREYMLGRGRTKDGQDVVRESSETSKGDDEVHVVEDVLENETEREEIKKQT